MNSAHAGSPQSAPRLCLPNFSACELKALCKARDRIPIGCLQIPGQSQPPAESATHSQALLDHRKALPLESSWLHPEMLLHHFPGLWCCHIFPTHGACHQPSPLAMPRQLHQNTSLPLKPWPDTTHCWRNARALHRSMKKQGMLSSSEAKVTK